MLVYVWGSTGWSFSKEIGYPIVFYNLLLYLLLLACFFKPAVSAGLDSFALPTKKITQSKKKNSKTKRKKIKMIIKKNKKLRPLEKAVLWHAPSNKALAPTRSLLEEQEIDYKAIEIIMQALEKNNPKYAAAKKRLGKKKSLALNLGSSILSLSPLNMSSFVEDKIQDQDDAKSLLQSMTVKAYGFYQELKSFYKPRLIRNETLLHNHKAVRAKLFLLCGLAATEELDSLLRGSR